MVVSSTKPKRCHNEISMLGALPESAACIGVTFSPCVCLADKLARLDSNLKCKRVQNVWLEIGTTRNALTSALRALTGRYPKLTQASPLAWTDGARSLPSLHHSPGRTDGAPSLLITTRLDGRTVLPPSSWPAWSDVRRSLYPHHPRMDPRTKSWT